MPRFKTALMIDRSKKREELKERSLQHILDSALAQQKRDPEEEKFWNELLQDQQKETAGDLNDLLNSAYSDVTNQSKDAMNPGPVALLHEAQCNIQGLSTVDELNKAVDANLEKMGFEDMCQDALGALQHQIKVEEERIENVEDIFKQCGSDLDAFIAQHADLSDGGQVTQMLSGTESDDDLQILEATVNLSGYKLAPAHGSYPLLRQTIATAPKSVGVSNSDGSSGGTLLEKQRQHLLNMLEESLVSHRSGAPKPSVADAQKKQLPTQPQQPAAVLKPPPMTSLPHKLIEPSAGMKVFSRKVNDIWYRSTVMEVHNKDRPRNERRYRVKFSYKGTKVVTGRNMAIPEMTEVHNMLPVGSRIIALYKEDNMPSAFYAGIVAEPPSFRNQYRYLIFFDDGYAQYCDHTDIHKVCDQSKNVWEDLPDDSRDFIRAYLQQYPERPMVRLQVGQVVKTEWNGKWWVASVQETDASLVKMYFDADHRVEWIYRGSTRLEPLYTELANMEASRLAGMKSRRHHSHRQQKSSSKPFVEYLHGGGDDDQTGVKPPPPPQPKAAPADDTIIPISRQSSSDSLAKDGQKKKPVARKSTAMKNNDSTRLMKGTEFQASSASRNTVGKDVASVLQGRTAQEYADDEEAMGERMKINTPIANKIYPKFVAHKCGVQCVKDEGDPTKYIGNNPLLIAQLCSWERQLAKQRNTGKRTVFYRAPCGRRLRSMDETDTYLMLSQSKLTIDYFCYDSVLHTDTEYVPVKTFCDIKDLSYGRETVPISCVNGIDRQYPDYVEYSNQRIPAKGVALNLDQDFLVCCDCTDGCRDRTRCRCIQMTQKASQTSLGGKMNRYAGYHHRRLQEPLITGVYECNSRCKCNSKCSNRVVQNGLSLRLQVFKTERRGWGLRCLDDIPGGGFICIYAGQLLTEQGANEDGQQYGDEYLAELDYIEVVEGFKEGYESEVDEEAMKAALEQEENEENEDDEGYNRDKDTDSTFSGERLLAKHRQKRDTSSEAGIGKIVLKRDSQSRNKVWSVQAVKENALKKTEEWLKNIPDSSAIVISDEESCTSQPATPKRKSERCLAALAKQGEVVEVESEESEEPANDTNSAKAKQKRATRSTTQSRFRNLPDPKARTVISPVKNKMAEMKERKKEKKTGPPSSAAEKEPKPSTRSLFGEEACFVMDAKSMGNLGRYLNHSCSPNVFVQNVFVDTHDLRFPWVAFFAYNFIRAGTELTWDYNYEVGSVPGKVLYCYCGSAECRGRLL